LSKIKATYKLLSKNSTFEKKDLKTKEEYLKALFEVLENYAKFYLDFFSTNNSNSNLYKDVNRSLLFSIMFGKVVRLEYLDGFDVDTSGEKVLLKTPTWKLFNLKDSNVLNIIQNKSLFMRMVNVNIDMFFFNDTKTDLQVINRYFIMEKASSNSLPMTPLNISTFPSFNGISNNMVRDY